MLILRYSLPNEIFDALFHKIFDLLLVAMVQIFVQLHDEGDGQTIQHQFRRLIGTTDEEKRQKYQKWWKNNIDETIKPKKCDVQKRWPQINEYENLEGQIKLTLIINLLPHFYPRNNNCDDGHHEREVDSPVTLQKTTAHTIPTT